VRCANVPHEGGAESTLFEARRLPLEEAIFSDNELIRKTSCSDAAGQA
jgi:hypothetical protein